MTKRFDAVAWMRKRREEIDKEDEGLTWEQKARGTVDLLQKDPLWKRLKRRLVAPPADRRPGAPGSRR